MAAGPSAAPRVPTTPATVLAYLRGNANTPYGAPREKDVITWLQANPGWVGKHWDALSRGKRSNTLARAGFYVRSRGNKQVLRNPRLSGALAEKDLWSWSRLPGKTAPQDKVTKGGKTKPTAPPPGGAGGAAPAGDSTVPGGVQMPDTPVLDTRLLAELMKQTGTGQDLPVWLANRGAKVMSKAEQQALIDQLLSGSDASLSIMEKDRERTARQNEQNLKNITGWYDQVLQSQGVAAQRDTAATGAAVGSLTDATQAIVSSLGGQANEGSYVVGATGAQGVGNLQALGQIADQYNADIAPLLQAEKAGSLAREQGAGAARLADMARTIAQGQADRRAQAAGLRFDIWKGNNEILDKRLTNELAIRQQNSANNQQRFANQFGVAQALLGAQVSGAQLQSGALNTYLDYLAAQQRAAGKTKGKPVYAKASQSTKNSAYNDIVGALTDSGLPPEQAQRRAMYIVNSYGWSIKNPAVQGLVRAALGEAGYGT